MYFKSHFLSLCMRRNNNSSLKKPNLKPCLSTQEASRKSSWKLWKKKSVRSKSSALSEIASWKHKKKKPIHILPRRSSSKKPCLITKSPSRKESWKYRKKKSTLNQRSSLKEDISWKRRKKKTSPKLVPEPKSSSLKKSVTWKWKKKDCCSQEFLFDIYDWKPGITSLIKTHESSFFFGWECADACGSKESLDNNITSLILFTINVMFIVRSMSYNPLFVT